MFVPTLRPFLVVESLKLDDKGILCEIILWKFLFWAPPSLKIISFVIFAWNTIFAWSWVYWTNWKSYNWTSLYFLELRDEEPLCKWAKTNLKCHQVIKIKLGKFRYSNCHKRLHMIELNYTFKRLKFIELYVNVRSREGVIPVGKRSLKSLWCLCRPERLC